MLAPFLGYYLNTAGVNIGYHRVQGVHEKSYHEGHHKVNCCSKVHPYSDPQFDLIQLAKDGNLLLVYNVATTTTKFQLVSVLY